MTHNVNVPLQRKRPNWTYTLNDYFLARGFAVVYSAGIGTLDSQGFRSHQRSIDRRMASR
ncbi:MAG: Hypothetical protein AJITA_00607 [Acetilactobacillus jinshanensis]